MDAQQGKAWYSQILVKAREAVQAANGVDAQLTKGSLRKAAHEIWTEVAPESPFELWWNEIHRIGLAPSNGVDKKGSDAYLNRYRDMAAKYTSLPLDAMLREMWGCADGTLSSIRSRLKAEGFAFEESIGGWSVIKRPEPPKPPAPAPLVQPELALPTANNQDIITRLDTIITLLRSLGAAWNTER